MGKKQTDLEKHLDEVTRKENLVVHRGIRIIRHAVTGNQSQEFLNHEPAEGRKQSATLPNLESERGA